MKPTILDKILHVFVHNGFFVTSCVLFLTHCALFFIMLYIGVVPLVWFNFGSIMAYALCAVLCKKDHPLPVYIITLVEVVSYSIFATRYIGWETGSAQFLICLVPLIIYFGHFLFKQKNRSIIFLLIVIDFAIYVALYQAWSSASVIYPLPQRYNAFLFILSSFMTIFAIMTYSIVYAYSTELKTESLKRKNAKLKRDVSVDTLTGLLNRRGFLPILNQIVLNDETVPHFCIAFCDIDNFKKVNDTYGHDCGDEVLKHVTHIIKKEMPGCNICRWGGEEILILMPDYDGIVAKEKMEYLRKSVANNHVNFYNKQIKVTITIGLEEYNTSYKNSDSIIKVADQRMYYGKTHGKNVVISEDIVA